MLTEQRCKSLTKNFALFPAKFLEENPQISEIIETDIRTELLSTPLSGGVAEKSEVETED